MVTYDTSFIGSSPRSICAVFPVLSLRSICLRSDALLYLPPLYLLPLWSVHLMPLWSVHLMPLWSVHLMPMWSVHLMPLRSVHLMPTVISPLSLALYNRPTTVHLMPLWSVHHVAGACEPI